MSRSAWRPFDFRDGCELGIKIGPGNLRGRGYATEAVTLLIDYVFDTMGLAAVRGSTWPTTTACRGSSRRTVLCGSVTVLS